MKITVLNPLWCGIKYPLFERDMQMFCKHVDNFMYTKMTVLF